MERKSGHINTLILLSALWILVLGTIYKDFRKQFLWPYYGFKKSGVHIEFDLAIHEALAEPEQGELYYNTGKGFNENDTVKFTYSQDSDGTFKHYDITLNADNSISWLRFDPMQNEGRLTIKNIVVRQHHPEPLDLTQSDRSWIAYKGIKEMVPIPPKGMQITTDGNDPHLLLTDNLAAYYQRDVMDFIRYIGKTKIAVASGLALLVILLAILL